ncbi:hypothetical protein FGO68_gene3414 [Halteria grandinella]|uniref:Uncharacterized protein n=1 Tax=Halteria grandinella TaxID=5974 RepID=A0A8J8NXQ5_HALGN|nr:hypothetical protein FGO68_gene3414 [Halteria grandinella]
MEEDQAISTTINAKNGVAPYPDQCRLELEDIAEHFDLYDISRRNQAKNQIYSSNKILENNLLESKGVDKFSQIFASRDQKQRLLADALNHLIFLDSEERLLILSSYNQMIQQRCHQQKRGAIISKREIKPRSTPNSPKHAFTESFQGKYWMSNLAHNIDPAQSNAIDMSLNENQEDIEEEISIEALLFQQNEEFRVTLDTLKGQLLCLTRQLSLEIKHKQILVKALREHRLKNSQQDMKTKDENSFEEKAVAERQIKTHNNLQIAVEPLDIQTDSALLKLESETPKFFASYVTPSNRDNHSKNLMFNFNFPETAQD